MKRFCYLVALMMLSTPPMPAIFRSSSAATASTSKRRGGLPVGVLRFGIDPGNVKRAVGMTTPTSPAMRRRPRHQRPNRPPRQPRRRGPMCGHAGRLRADGAGHKNCRCGQAGNRRAAAGRRCPPKYRRCRPRSRRSKKSRSQNRSMPRAPHPMPRRELPRCCTRSPSYPTIPRLATGRPKAARDRYGSNACGRALCGYVLDPASSAKTETVLINMKPKDGLRMVRQYL